MRCVGTSTGLELWASDDAYLSYFNSPYVGHKHRSAVDIYPNHREWGGPVVSPCAGTIIRVKKSSMGKKREFPTSSFDYGIGIQPEESESEVVRVLHCKPKIREGDNVDQGDLLGFTIRSRYFHYWTGPHSHVEVLNPKYFLRSTKSYPLTPPVWPRKSQCHSMHSEIECTVHSVSEDVLIAISSNYPIAEIDGLSGLLAMFQERKEFGILDGGISHYPHGGVIGKHQASRGENVNLGDFPLGFVDETCESYTHFIRGPRLQFSVDEINVRGISCYLFSKKQKIKGMPPLVIVPQTYGQFVGQYDEGDVFALSIKMMNQRQR